MAKANQVAIELGSEKEVATLFSYGLKPPYNKAPIIALPENPRKKVDLKGWVLHWVNQTLQRDGYALTGSGAAKASISIDKGTYVLVLTGPRGLSKYADRIPEFLEHGKAALQTIAKIKSSDKDKPQKRKYWDRRKTGEWRFFLPFGLAMANQRSIQYFHYPPLRLLNTNKDYLDDPVPRRWEELLIANGVPEDQVTLYETVMDCAPIGAPDDEGSQGYIPVSSFGAYQKSQVDLLLNHNHSSTIPIVVYGAPARKRFFANYRSSFPKSMKKWDTGDARSVKIIRGTTTPALAMNHPYAFYMNIQKNDEGEFAPGVHPRYGFYAGLSLMIESLVTARWQMKMAAKPSQNAKEVLKQCQDYWGWWPKSGRKFDEAKYKPAAKQAQRDQTAAMILHQASLKAGLTGTWEFKRTLAESQELVKQFKKGSKSGHGLANSSLLRDEKVKTVNELLEFLCSG